MPNLVNDFEVRKETLRALGGDPTGLSNIFEVDKEILRLTQQGGSGITDAPIDGVQYARQDGTWTPVENGVDWNTIKQKLAEDGVNSIKFLKTDYVNTKKYIGFDDGAMPFYTGHTITPNTRVQMKFRCLKGTDNAFIGMRMSNPSDNKKKWRFVRLGGDNAFQQICDVNVEHRCTVWDINPDNWYELELGNCYIKDVQTGEILAQNTDTESGSWGELVLNACRGEKGDIEYVKVFEGDELVRDYIAAEDEDGNIGFYESLSSTFTIASRWQRSENNDWTVDYPVQGEVILTGEEVETLLNQTVLPDAPSDGKTYGRNNGAWTPVEEGLTDAPSDGKTYGRNNGAWTAVKEGISDAPSDDTQYARQNGAWVPVQTPTEGKYITITADKSNTGETIIHPNIEGSLPNLNLQYRINNGKWNDFIVGTTDDIKIGAGDVLQFKGDNKDGISTNSGNNTLNFGISGNPVALSGNIMSLIDGIGETTVIPCDYCFCRLFRNSVIKTVSSDFLPATTLKTSCYRDLFSGCQNLTQAPDLPATTLATDCYYGMFYNCASLTNAPELPAKVLLEGCYGYMFTYCYLLNYVKCLATEGTINGDGTVPSALNNWLQGVASTGTFEKLSGVSYEAGGHHGIPEGWTVKEIYEYVEAPLDGNQYARQNGTWTVVETGISDSPSDGKQYARQNGAWTPVESVEPGISDAPSDGQQYARQDGAWTPVTEGITDSPSDGQQYARQNGNWAVVEKGITDSPSDGKQYARQDGAWSVVEGILDAPIDGVQYARKNGEWTPVEKGLDWNTIKQKLAGDGVESIKFIMSGEEVILTASEVKTLLNQTVLPDAPSDGQKYARQNGNWAPVTEGITDSPSDGQKYARQDGAWTTVTEGITDSPSDGKTYGRNNGAWAPVESGYPIKQGVEIDNNVVSVENYGQYTRLNGNFIEIEKNQEGNIRLYDKLEVTMPGEQSKTASFIDILNAGNGVVKTTNNTTLQFWSGTQQEYDAIATKDANTLYIIK